MARWIWRLDSLFHPISSLRAAPSMFSLGSADSALLSVASSDRNAWPGAATTAWPVAPLATLTLARTTSVRTGHRVTGAAIRSRIADNRADRHHQLMRLPRSWRPLHVGAPVRQRARRPPRGQAARTICRTPPFQSWMSRRHAGEGGAADPATCSRRSRPFQGKRTTRTAESPSPFDDQPRCSRQQSAFDLEFSVAIGGSRCPRREAGDRPATR
jgi:hypothetical protein